jgi:hypothetical protein
MTRRPIPIIATVLTLGACTTQHGIYPSLAPRPIEQRSDAEPSRPTPVATPDSALDSHIAELTDTLQQSDSAFAAAAGRARTLVAAARSAGVGSTAWLDAQTALADLDGERARTTSALGALDELAIARAKALQAPYPALETAHDRAEAQAAQQDQVIATLQAQLPGG